jgi:hypothetical protein
MKGRPSIMAYLHQQLKPQYLSNEQLLEATRQAFEKNEIAEFLQGLPPYTCSTREANVPTDFVRILRQGIYKLYDETKNKQIANDFKAALRELASGNAVQIWIAFEHCFSQIRNEYANVAPFKIMDSGLINHLKDMVNKSENELRACKEWMGWKEKDGLWSDIVRLNEILNRRYGGNIL